MQSDWNASSGDAAILNKPTIPTLPSDSQIGDKAFSNPPSTLTNAEKEDVRAAIWGAKLTKSVAGNSNVTLTADEGTYRSIRFTGALTGNIIVTVPALGAGLLLFDNGTTGSSTLKVKATGQSDSTAVTLASGQTVIKHSGTVISALTEGGGGTNPRGAGDGLVLDGNDLDVNTGDGLEISSDKVRVKLDGSTLARSSSGLKVADDSVGPTQLDADTTTKKQAIRTEIGAGTSSFSGAYSDLTGKPTIPVDTTIFKGAWTASTSYAVGDIVTRTNKVYLCITANSDSSFTASKWEQLDIGSATDIVSVSGSGATLTFTKRDGTTQAITVSASLADDSVTPAKLDADTAVKKAAMQARIATGRLSKSIAGGSDVTLTAAEGAYDSIELTGARTADGIVTFPAAPSGVRLVKLSTTGQLHGEGEGDEPSELGCDHACLWKQRSGA